MKTPKAAIIILNWNGFEDTCQCINSILSKKENNDHKIIVVDNNSAHDEPEKLKKRYGSQITLLENNHNLGYCGGNNVGFNYATSHHFDQLLIVNNDTIFTSHLIENLSQHLKNSVKIVGANIIDYQNQSLIQNRGLKYNKYLGIISAVDCNKSTDRLTQKNSANSISGACFLINANFLIENNLVLFDEDYFCYGEEIDLCERLAKKGAHIHISKQAIIYHKGSVSAQKIPGFTEKQIIKNKFLFIKKHGNCIQKLSFLFFTCLIYLPIRSLILTKNPSNLKHFLSGFHEGLKKFL